MNLSVEKKLTVYEVSEIREKIIGILDSGSDLQIDLCRVTECDTAGIQLLCSILRTVQKKKAPITFHPFSKAIQDAARIIKVELEAG
jgi:ABC-type transporter Mla MlaB component